MQQDIQEPIVRVYRNVYSYPLSEEVENVKLNRRIAIYGYLSNVPVFALVMFICLNAGLPEWAAGVAGLAVAALILWTCFRFVRKHNAALLADKLVIDVAKRSGVGVEHTAATIASMIGRPGTTVEPLAGEFSVQITAKTKHNLARLVILKAVG